MARKVSVMWLMLVAALAGCSATEAAGPAGATCEQFESTPSIDQARTIEVGTNLTIVLCSNPSTGYAWDDPALDATVLELADRTYQAPDQGPLPIVGAAGGEVITIRGLAPGTAAVSLRYGQPWDGGAASEWTYRLQVTVE